jgi:hypothetical protein
MITYITVVGYTASVSNPIIVLPYILLGGIKVYGIPSLFVVALTLVTVASSVETVLLY